MTVQSQSSSQAQTEAQDKEAQDSSAIQERKIIVHEVTMRVVGCTIAPYAPFSLDLGLLFGVPVIYLCSRYFRRNKFLQNFAKCKRNRKWKEYKAGLSIGYLFKKPAPT